MIEEKVAAIVGGMETYLKGRVSNCKVILANQTAPVPDYPYVTYTVTQPRIEAGGTYGVENDGTRSKQFDMAMSFTVQSDDEEESVTIAVKAARWTEEIGTVYLGDNEIAVKRVGSITNRDNILANSVYEYRNGFDATFTTLERISEDEFLDRGTIEEFEFNKEV